MKDYVWKRLWAILSGDDNAKEFAHLSPQDRQAIAEILQDTVAELPDFWQVATGERVSVVAPE